jgi:hypothetical protein
MLVSNEYLMKTEQRHCRDTLNCVHCAVIGGSSEIIRTLEIKGFEFDGAVHYAVRWHRRSIFQWLHENRSPLELNSVFGGGDIIFHSAQSVNYYAASLSLQKDIRFDLERSLDTVVQRCGPVALRFLFDVCNAKIIGNRKLLFQAIDRRDLDIVKVLCSHCPELVNEVCDGVAPIWAAATEGLIEITRYLSGLPGIHIGFAKVADGLTSDPLEFACYQFNQKAEMMPSVWLDCRRKQEKG